METKEYSEKLKNTVEYWRIQWNTGKYCGKLENTVEYWRTQWKTVESRRVQKNKGEYIIQENTVEYSII